MGHTHSDRCPETCPDSKFLDVVHSDFVRRREHDQVRPLVNEEEEERRRAADRFWEERRVFIVADTASDIRSLRTLPCIAWIETGSGKSEGKC